MNPIDRYIRRLSDGGSMADIYGHAQVATSELNAMADNLEAAGDALGAMVQAGKLPAAALQPLMARLPSVQAQHGASVQALTQIKAKCESPNPFFKDDKGAITSAERKGRVVVNTPLYARALIADAKINAQLIGKHKPTGMVLFDRGEMDDVDVWGWGAVKADRYHTNLDKDGTLPKGFFFECFGVSVQIEAQDGSEVVPSDLRKLNDAYMWWTEANEKVAIPLCHIGRAPAVTRVTTQTGADATQAVRTEGQPFIQEAPLFRLRDTSDKHGLLVRFPDGDAQISKKYVVTFFLEGALGIVPGGLS